MKLSATCLLALAGSTLASAQQPIPGRPPGPDIARLQQQEGEDMALLLGLRPAQRVALDDYLASARPPRPGAMGDRPPPPPPNDPPSFGEQLSRMEQLDADRATKARDRLTAMRRFYVQLDSNQKGLFEALMRVRHAPGGPWMSGGPDRHHGGPGMRGDGLGGPPPPGGGGPEGPGTPPPSN